MPAFTSIGPEVNAIAPAKPIVHRKTFVTAIGSGADRSSCMGGWFGRVPASSGTNQPFAQISRTATAAKKGNVTK